MPDFSQLTKKALMVAVVIIMGSCCMYACSISLDKQTEADYQKCLNWQNSGYSVRCSKE